MLDLFAGVLKTFRDPYVVVTIRIDKCDLQVMENLDFIGVKNVRLKRKSQQCSSMTVLFSPAYYYMRLRRLTPDAALRW